MDKVTRRKFLGTASLAAAGTAMGPWVLRARAQSGPIKIGVVLPYTGVYAVLGESITQAMELVFARENWTVAGRKIEMIKEDDEMKPPVGVRKTEKLIDSDKVDILTGPVHSGILMGMRDKVHNSKTILIVSNAGADAISRDRCSRWIFRTSFSNWQPCQPMGGWVAKNVSKDVFLTAPNYQAGKDMLTGFERYYKGGIKGQILFKLTQQDFQAELSQIRAARPDAVFAFVPGAWGISLFKQFDAAGLRQQMKLYTAFSLDETTLGAIGEAAVGTYVTGFWSHDLDYPQNKKFVEAFKKKFNYDPSLFAAQSFDGVYLIDSGVKGVKGDLKNRDGIRAALKKADFPSVRGKYSYNTNHFPIQNFYKMEVVKDASGKVMLKNRGAVFKDHKDSYAKECKMS